MITANIAWDQVISFSVLLFILYSVTSGKIRIDLAAFGGLLFLGLIGVTPMLSIFSGFANPALYTIASVLIVSAAIAEGGVVRGLGKRVAEHSNAPEKQILKIGLISAAISSFMNNVGAIGILLPTIKRMATRAKIKQASFGLPLIYASILGGSATLIGTASNIIVSTYRYTRLGESFKMFDFAYHGLTMLAVSLIIWFASKLFGYDPLQIKELTAQKNSKESLDLIDTSLISQSEISDKKQKIYRYLTIIVLIAIVFLTSFRLIHSAVGFGMAAILFVAIGMLKPHRAYKALNLSVLIFIGSMISLSQILESTGALSTFVSFIMPWIQQFPPILIIWSIMLVTALIANMVDNSVSAVLMSPIVISLASEGVFPVPVDALLMAVAAGASLGLVLPTHQVTLVVMNQIDFPRKTFIRQGTIIAFFAGIAAAFTINLIWC